MRTFNKQAASLKKSLKQNNLMPLFVVFSFIVMLSLTYKSVSKVNGVGNTMFKEGNRNRRRRVRQGFREGSEHEDPEYFEEDDEGVEGVEGGDDVGGADSGPPDDSPEGFLNGGGIGRKAGFVEIKEGMPHKWRKAHKKEHELMKERKKRRRKLKQATWDRRGGVPPSSPSPRPPPRPPPPPSQRRPTYLD